MAGAADDVLLSPPKKPQLRPGLAADVDTCGCGCGCGGGGCDREPPGPRTTAGVLSCESSRSIIVGESGKTGGGGDWSKLY